MGLDMYLQAERYLGRWQHTTEEGRGRADAALAAADLAAYQVENAGVEVVATAMRWRKANAIHRWFVENVQHGVDDCRRAYVSREQLVELRDLCQLVLGSVELVPDTVTHGWTLDADGAQKPILEMGKQILNPAVAQQLLPTVEGFFFGSTDYDEGYVDDLVATVEGLNRILALPENGVDYYYTSSW
jgi:hypothetical protein